MTTLWLRACTHFKTAGRRRRLASRSLVVALALTLLIIPATCAEAAGPHSIFVDPATGHRHHHAEASEQPLTQAALELRVILGSGTPELNLGAQSVAEDDCPGDLRFQDLPSTLAISAVSTPATLGDILSLEFPHLDAPAILEPPALHAIFSSPDSPPPRINV